MLVLVRHGAVDGRFKGMCFGQRFDPPLGDQNAFDVEGLLAALPAEARVAASPARRARETASLFATEFAIDSRWSERDFGTWEGRRWDDCWSETSPEHLTSPDAYVAFSPPGAETHDEVVARVEAAMGETLEPLVVVTHAGVIRAALVVAGLTVTAAQGIPLPNLGVTVLTRRARSARGPRDQWTVRRVGPSTPPGHDQWTWSSNVGQARRSN